MTADPGTRTITRVRFAGPAVADTHITHATILGALPDNGSRVLWASPTRDLLIVQAATAMQPLHRTAEHSHAPVHTRWAQGDLVRLSLIANPVRTPLNPAGRGQRRPLPLDQCEAWLRRKIGHTVDIGEVMVEEMGTRAGVRRGARIAHRLVGFAAVGHVTDPDGLRALQLDGVGPGKAYGAGLLLVTRA